MRRVDDQEVSRYATFGIAAALPGMQLAVDTLQAQLNEMRNQLAALQGGVSTHKRRGRPPKSLSTALQATGKSGWPSDPEERSREMKRRQQVAMEKKLAKAKKASHPRDPDHPDHEAWLAKMRKGTKKRWGAMTAAERKRRIDSMIAGRQKKAPVVKLEAAS